MWGDARIFCSIVVCAHLAVGRNSKKLQEKKKSYRLVPPFVNAVVCALRTAEVVEEVEIKEMES